MTGQHSWNPQPWGTQGCLAWWGCPGLGRGLARPTGVPVAVWEAGAVAACSLCDVCDTCAVCWLQVTVTCVSSACPLVLPTCHCALSARPVCAQCPPPAPCVALLAPWRVFPPFVTRTLHTQYTLKRRFPAGCGNNVGSQLQGTGTLGQALLPWASLPGAHPCGICGQGMCTEPHKCVQG